MIISFYVKFHISSMIIALPRIPDLEDIRGSWKFDQDQPDLGTEKVNPKVDGVGWVCCWSGGGVFIQVFWLDKENLNIMIEMAEAITDYTNLK